MKDVAIGVDVVDVERFRAALLRWPRLGRRIFTDRELEACSSSSERLAARFAAKEAAFKALGDGWPSVSYHDVEVLTVDDAPALRLSGHAETLAGRRVPATSLAHDGGVAIAGVVLAPTEEG